MPQIPIFEPSWEEFKDFKKYLQSIYPIFEPFGMCKVRPPKEWCPIKCDTENFANFETYSKNTKLLETYIPIPIKQFADGGKGFYQCTLIEQNPLSLTQYMELSKSEEKQAGGDMKRETMQDFQILEEKFWKNIQFFPPTYGADMCGSLFAPNTPWDLKNLDSILNALPSKLGGINEPYLYFGMWKAMFSWHVEDMNLPSINYLHFGEPKQWYSIPSNQSVRFENFVKSHFKESCPEFLRHKTTMISPSQILRENIEVYSTVHYPGEFMITYPHAYHAGFNYGFNCAESVNFAHEEWIPFGRVASWCQCDDLNAKLSIPFLESHIRHKEMGLKVGKTCNQMDCELDQCRSRKRKFLSEQKPVVRLKLQGETYYVVDPVDLGLNFDEFIKNTVQKVDLEPVDQQELIKTE